MLGDRKCSVPSPSLGRSCVCAHGCDAKWMSAGTEKFLFTTEKRRCADRKRLFRTELRPNKCMLGDRTFSVATRSFRRSCVSAHGCDRKWITTQTEKFLLSTDESEGSGRNRRIRLGRPRTDTLRADRTPSVQEAVTAQKVRILPTDGLKTPPSWHWSQDRSRKRN